DMARAAYRPPREAALIPCATGKGARRLAKLWTYALLYIEYQQNGQAAAANTSLSQEKPCSTLMLCVFYTKAPFM
ncbi:hypothetical protein, partial [Desulfovibrio legallii]|uniref:hypothetical protein n=2 Tax=Desulfovibrio TaxID=872 RepID=UPI0022E5C561